MSWTDRLSDYIGRKYLGEIAREMWALSRKKKPVVEGSLKQSFSIPYQTLMLFMAGDLNQYPDTMKTMLEKCMVQNTCLSDPILQSSIHRSIRKLDNLSKREIELTEQRISEGETHSSLPVLDNLLFREGLSEKEYLWFLLMALLDKLPSLHQDFGMDINKLKQAKMVYWEKEYVNINHRIPELYRLFELAQEMKPDLSFISSELQCQNVIIGRESPFYCYLIINPGNDLPVLVAFLE